MMFPFKMARFSFLKCYFETYILLSGSKNVTLLPVVRGCVVLPIPSAVTHISAAALELRTHVFGISQCPPPRTPTLLLLAKKYLLTFSFR